MSDDTIYIHKDSLSIFFRCRHVEIWKEDDVWNASATSLPVAAFGDTLEEAVQNVKDAIALHLEVAGDFDP